MVNVGADGVLTVEACGGWTRAMAGSRKHDFAFGTQIKTLSALSLIAGVAPLGLVGVRCAATSRPHIRASAPSHARQSSPSR